MGSFSKTKILTLVMFFMTTVFSIQSHSIELSADTPKQTEDKLKDAKESRLEARCDGLAKEYNASITKVASNCKAELESCIGSTDSRDAENLLSTLLITTVQYNVLPTGTGKNQGCEFSYDKHEAKTRTLTDRDDRLTEKMATLEEKIASNDESYNKEIEKIEEKQVALNEELQDMQNKENKSETEATTEISKAQIDLSQQGRQLAAQIRSLRTKLKTEVNKKQILFANYSLDTIARLCRNKINSDQSEFCKKDPSACQKKVSSSVGNATATGGMSQADKNAAYKECVNNQSILSSQAIDDKTSELKNIQSDINAAEASAEDIKLSIQIKTDDLRKSLEQLKTSNEQKKKILEQKFLQLQDSRNKLEQLNLQKKMSLTKQRFALTSKQSVAAMERNNLGTRSNNCGELSARDSLNEIERQETVQDSAIGAGCCGNTDATVKKILSGPVCRDEKVPREKRKEGKDKRKGLQRATGAE